MMNRKLSLFKKAPFPLIMTITSFLLFIFIYWVLTMMTVEPYYLIGLIFALPFIIFGLLAYFTARGLLGKVLSTIITSLLIIAFGFSAFTGLIYILIDASTTSTSDIGKYERVLRITGHPKDHLTQYFPEKIPEQARGIIFHYNPAFMQAGEKLGLKFSIDDDLINRYTDEFLDKAKWIGKLSDEKAIQYGMYPYVFDLFDYKQLPDDFTIYIFSSKPYKTDDWNHGEFSIAAISKERNEIIFLMEDW